jgi:hypothetical protein
MVYTEGSIQNDYVGAAAALYGKGKSPMRTLRLHLGTASEHMVYEAEPIGLLLGLQLIGDSVRERPRRKSEGDVQRWSVRPSNSASSRQTLWICLGLELAVVAVS